MLDRNFEGTSYSLKSLFRDEQRRVVENILGHVVEEANNSYRQIYDNHASSHALPSRDPHASAHVMLVTAAFVINEALRRLIVEGPLDLVRFGAFWRTRTATILRSMKRGSAFDLRERLEGGQRCSGGQSQ